MGVTMALPVSFYGETVADNTVKSNGEPETASWAVPVATLTAANYVAKKALIDALASSIQNLSLGVPQKSEIIIDREFLSTSPAGSTNAQRENKYLFRYSDNVTHKKFRMSYPVADLSKLVSGSEFIVLTSGVGATIKTDFEAIVVSPDDATHAVTLDSIQFVGRSS